MKLSKQERNISIVKKWLQVAVISLLVILLIMIVLFSAIKYHDITKQTNNKEIKNLNPIEYLIHTFQYSRDTTTNNKGNNANNPNANKSNTQKDHIIGNTNNILGDTQNILTYITIIIAIIGVLVGIALFKYLRNFFRLQDRVDETEERVLDATNFLTNAIPLCEPTQIISSEYHKTMNSITTKIEREQYLKLVEKNPEYVNLLFIRGLNYIINKNYERGIKILKEAYDLSNENYTKKVIAFHIARVNKQQYFEKIKNCENTSSKNKEKIEELNYEIDRWIGKTFYSYKEVIEISVSLINWHYNNDKESEDLKKSIYNTIIKSFDSKYAPANKELSAKERSIINLVNDFIRFDTKLINLNQMTAFTIILLYHKELIPQIDSSKLEKCAKQFLPLLKREVGNWRGLNIKASWYYTIYQIACKHLNNNETNMEMNTEHKVLWEHYFNQSQSLKEMYGYDDFKLFNCYILAEVENNNFKYEKFSKHIDCIEDET